MDEWATILDVDMPIMVSLLDKSEGDECHLCSLLCFFRLSCLIISYLHSCILNKFTSICNYSVILFFLCMFGVLVTFFS